MLLGAGVGHPGMQGRPAFGWEVTGSSGGLCASHVHGSLSEVSCLHGCDAHGIEEAPQVCRQHASSTQEKPADWSIAWTPVLCMIL
jgi:hypothetical protein